MRFKNPPNLRVFKFDLLVGAPFIVFGTIALIFGLGPFDGIAIFIAIAGAGVAMYVLSWYREFVHRPIAIELMDHGIAMEFRYGDRKFCQWNDISGLISRKDKEGVIELFSEGVGALILWKGDPYFTTYEISEAIRSKYRETQGKEMPLMMVNEREKGFRKRVLLERSRGN